MARGLVAVLLLGTVTGTAYADISTDLYVNNAAAAHCSDNGAGDPATPFCTIQAAADVVEPGQTVHILAGKYAGDVHVTRSGTPTAPITFLGANTSISTISVAIDGTHGFVLSGVHDVVISAVLTSTSAEGFAVANATHVTIVGNRLNGVAAAQGVTPTAGIGVTGASSSVTVQGNIIDEFGTAISIGSGSSDAVVTLNDMDSNRGSAIVATDTSNTLITGNTMTTNCGSGIVVAGASPNAVLENNISYADAATSTTDTLCGSTSTLDPEISVSAAAAPTATEDYNLVAATSGNALYSWAGINYSNATALRAAVGQGAHDVNVSPHFSDGGRLLSEASPAIDAGTGDAPGEPGTDIEGRVPVDDPLVADSGTDVRDIGAFEFTDPLTVTRPLVRPTKNVDLVDVTATSTVTNPWNQPVSYQIDFGDGSAPAIVSTPSATHSYPVPTQATEYVVTLTVTPQDGPPVVRTSTYRITAPAPMRAVLAVAPVPLGGAFEVTADERGSTGGWGLASFSIDFGDGRTPTTGTITVPPVVHFYQEAGTYTVTLTVVDGIGDTASTTQQVTVRGAYVPNNPVRVLDTRHSIGAPTKPLGANSTLNLAVSGHNGVPSTGVTAVVLNVTVVNSTTGGYVTAYPDGRARPATSSLNFVAGQTIANVVTVPVIDGHVDFYNLSGTVDLVADLEGYYTTDTGGSLFSAGPQTRLLDTRKGTGAPKGQVGPAQHLSLQVAGGPAVPDDATAVVMNVTVADATVGGFLTVYPDGASLPTTSNVNFSKNQTIPNEVIVPIGANGKVDFYNGFGSVDVIADVQGYFGPGNIFSYVPVTPTRLLDTRNDPNGKVGFDVPANGVLVPIGGPNQPVPLFAEAVVLNITVINPSTSGYLTAYPQSNPPRPMPGVSSLNFVAGETTSNMVTVPMNEAGEGGGVQIFANTGATDVVVDVEGYYLFKD
jgi:hypothetical protein